MKVVRVMNLEHNQLIWYPKEAALQKWSYKKMFPKYAAHLQENIHAEV